jgi:DNA-binding NarL/FixJ family response regulator
MSAIYSTVVLVAEPSVHQASLRAMVDSTSLLRVVGVASGCLSALRMVQEVHPDFVLIASNLPESEVVMFLDTVRESEAGTRVIVLRKIPWHKPHLLDAGASAVLSQDSSVTDLLAAFLSQTK